MLRPSLIFNAIAYIAIIGTVSGSAQAQIHPDFSRATLTLQGTRLRVTHMQSPALEQHLVGSNIIYLDGDKVECYDADGHHIWTASSVDKHDLEWLAADKSKAYLQGYTLDSNGYEVYASNPQVRRLDLKSGKWLPSLKVPLHDPQPSGSTNAVQAVLVRPTAVVVLSVVAKNDFIRDRMATYSVSAFQPNSEKLLWSKVYKSAGSGRLWPDRYFWSQPSNFSQQPAIQFLNWLGSNRILVCAGINEDILCLSTSGGQTVWKLSKVWEFQQGFIGPSSYTYFIGRFGQMRLMPDKNAASEEKQFEARYTCQITAGPVVTKASFGLRIFIAVARLENKAISDAIASPTADCLVYEISDGGTPLTMASLPEFVNGSQVTTVGDSVIWGCDKEAAIKISASDQTGFQEGPGSPDAVSQIDWYKQYKQLFPSTWEGWGNTSRGYPWLLSHAQTDMPAFDSRFFCRTDSGGYVMTQASHEYDFPIDIIDYATGDSQTTTLRVPFTGTLSAPDQDYEGVQGGLESHFTSEEPYKLWIDDLSFDGPRLRVVFGQDKGQTEAVEFNLASVH